MAVREYSSVRAEGEAEDANPLEGVAFTLDGERFECLGHVQLLDQSDLALLAAQGRGDMRSAEAQAASAAYLRVAFGDAEYMRFKDHVRQNKTPDRVVVEIMNGVIEEVERRVKAGTGRPIGLPSPSSGGPQGQEERISRIISLQKGDVQIMPGDRTAAAMAAARTGQRAPAKRKSGSRSGNPAKRAAASG